MRGLAERLGVGTMTLYGYFRSKDELLDALVDAAVMETPLSLRMATGQSSSARLPIRASRACCGIRASSNCGCAGRCCGRRPCGSAKRCCDPAGRRLQSRRSGRRVPAPVHLHRRFRRAEPRRRNRVETAGRARQRSAALPPDEFPALNEARDAASAAMGGEEVFAYGLDRIIDGLALRRERASSADQPVGPRRSPIDAVTRAAASPIAAAGHRSRSGAQGAARIPATAGESALEGLARAADDPAAALATGNAPALRARTGEPSRRARLRPPALDGAPAPAGRLLASPAPHRGLEAAVVGEQLVHADQVDAAARHRGDGRGRETVVALGGDRVGELGAVLEVADDRRVELCPREVGAAPGEISDAARPLLLMLVPEKRWCPAMRCPRRSRSPRSPVRRSARISSRVSSYGNSVHPPPPGGR